MFRFYSDIDVPVYQDGIRPKDYMDSNKSAPNFVGMVYNENEDTGRTGMFLSNDISRSSKNDFVSSLFNEETPLEEYGVHSRHDLDSLYHRLFATYSKTCPALFDNSLRVYQTRPDTLNIAPALDSLANSGGFAWKFDIGDKPWSVGPDDWHDYAL